MKITPIEIRQKEFEKALRGYDKDEVNAFLLTLSQEWERTLDESKEIRIKYEAVEREVTKLREVESSLFKTLKTAEDTGAHVITQAKQDAELHMRETQLKTDAMMNEAKAKAKNTIEEAEFASKQMLEEMEDRLKALVQSYKSIESHRDSLLSDLKRMASETLDRTERMKNAARDFDPEQHLARAKRETKKALYPNASEMESTPRVESTPKKSLEAQPILTESGTDFFAEAKASTAPKSFFDDIQ
jgi:cell division initiation protein